MAEAATEKAMEIIRKRGVVRPRDLAAYGIRRDCLADLQQKGFIQRVGRGLYVAADYEATEHHTLAEASKRVPHAVVTLLSALRFHGLTTQNPFEVWMAIGIKARRPELDWPPVRIVRFSGPALEYGVEEHNIEGVAVRVYTAAKTVADCFKYRNKIGLDVAIEALRDCWRKRKATADELWAATKVCRVTNVMRPYMDSLE
ncbi:MAG: transcriptional regulator [Armatimonadetes bacterium]|jgi:predicted transcriptional regulator of viral defense system|nr:transcriptional regulator [Armatimonadota bacterium]